MATTSGGLVGTPTDPNADNFVVESGSPNVGFLKKAVQPPSQVYIETTDQLIVSAASSQFNEVLTVNYRLLRFDGILVHGQFTILIASNRVLSVHAEPLAEGFLLSLSMKAAVAVTRGQTFARAFLTKPSLGAGQPSYMLMADYVTTAMAPGHPNGRVFTPVEGPGNIRSIAPPAPGPGFDWSTFVPINARWRIQAAIFSLQTSAAVANRYVSFETIESVGGDAFYPATAAVVAGSNVFICSNGAGAFVAADPTRIIAPFDTTVRLLGNSQMGSFTNGLQAGDQYGAIQLQVEEWLDNV